MRRLLPSLKTWSQSEEYFVWSSKKEKDTKIENSFAWGSQRRVCCSLTLYKRVCVCVCVTSKVEKQNKLRIFFDYHHMATLVCNFWFSCVLFSPFIFCWWIKKWWIKKIWLQKHSSSSSTSSSLLLDHCLWFCSHYNSLVVYCSSLRV